MVRFQLVETDQHLRTAGQVIRRSHETVAFQFGLTPENCPAHPAFISFEKLRSLRNERTRQYLVFSGESAAGFVAIERSANDPHVFYIEKVSVLPGFRHNRLGRQIMQFSEEQIVLLGGTKISLGIIDEHTQLKSWYISLGYSEGDTRSFPHLPFTVRYLLKTV